MRPSILALSAAVNDRNLNQSFIAEAFYSPFASSFAKYTNAFAIDGVGDLKPPVPSGVTLITTDDVPDTAGDTTPTLTVTGPGVTTPVVSTIDTIGDQDFYQVTLQAGVTYEIGVYSYNGGPNLVGLTDPYLEVYAADGTTLVVSADGGASTTYNELNSGFDVLLTYTPTASGTYYLNARAFSNSDATPTGDSVGDYQIFAREQDPNDPNIYRPYYDVDSPLYAIDWGTQVDKINHTDRNPDGDEGPRDTGNPQGSPSYSTDFDIPALAAEQGVDITGKNVITIYFAQAGDIFYSNDPTDPGLPPATITAVGVQDFEYDAVWNALHEFQKVADVVYIEVTDRSQADFIYTSYQGTPGPGVSLLGSMSPPGESDEGLAQFNSGDYRWNATDLQQGGFSFVTLIHEFGHGHGLAHPHDNGGRSGVMNGVEAEGAGVADYTTGDFELNQGVFTMMSYEDGWQSSPYGNAPTDVGYGYLGGLMAFDIAAIQDKYGVNEDWATGNDTYVLKDVNAAGTYYTSIWDAGGNDTIAYVGMKDAHIDLRPATLQYEVGGGGWVSYVDGIFGGFTIANSVSIENARGGNGNDVIIGNDGVNNLRGFSGDDHIYGGAGNDALAGGPGTDILEGQTGNDTYVLTDAFDTVIENAGEGWDTVNAYFDYTLTANVENLRLIAGGTGLAGTGNELDNRIYGSTRGDTISGLAGSDMLYGLAGDDTVHGGNHDDQIWGGTENDSLYGEGGDDLVFGEDGDDVLAGGADTDRLSGGDGNDTIVGGAGTDYMLGGAGADLFVFDEGDTSAVFAETDRVNDFDGGAGDRIDFAAIDANTLLGGDQAFDFIGTDAFSGVAGELRFREGTTAGWLEGDTNGDMVADVRLFVGTTDMVADYIVL